MPNKYLDDLTTLKEKVLSVAISDDRSITPEQLATLAAVCKTASEAQKAEIERAQLTKVARSETIRFWAPIVASFISVFILASTLGLQVSQFRSAAEQQAESLRLQASSLQQQTRVLQAQINSNEDTQWREAIKTMADKPALVNDAAGLAYLKAFVRSDRHREEAHTLATALIGAMVQADAFKSLFDALELEKNNKYEDVLQINRALTKMDIYLVDEADRLVDAQTKGQRTASVPIPGSTTPQYVDINLAIGLANNQLTEVFAERVITTRATEVLFRRSAVPGGIDLSKCAFAKGNFTNASFSGDTLTDTSFQWVDVTNADFSSVKVDRLGSWEGTAWWRCSKMSPDLLKTLTGSEYSFPRQKREYLGSSRAEFDRDVERLSRR